MILIIYTCQFVLDSYCHPLLCCKLPDSGTFANCSEFFLYIYEYVLCIIDKSVVGFIGNLRKDDAVSRELLLMFIKRLCTGYQNKDTRIVKILETTRVIFVPAVDVDGYSFELQRLVCSFNC